MLKSQSLGPRAIDGFEGGAHPHDVVLGEPELLGNCVGDGGLEALTGRRVVVDNPRRIGGLARGDRELAGREGCELGRRPRWTWWASTMGVSSEVEEQPAIATRATAEGPRPGA